MWMINASCNAGLAAQAPKLAGHLEGSQVLGGGLDTANGGGGVAAG